MPNTIACAAGNFREWNKANDNGIKTRFSGIVKSMNLMDRLFLGKTIKEFTLSKKSLPLLMSRKDSLIFSIRGKQPKIHLKSAKRMLITGGVNYTEIEFDNLDKVIKALMLMYGLNKKNNMADMTVEEIRSLFERELPE